MRRFGVNQTIRRATIFCLTLWLFLFTSEGRSALQFDVFPGYDTYVRDGQWFPITFEVSNDGPTFRAYIEVAGAQFSSAQGRRVAIDLPTGTLKRLTIPVFAGSKYGAWEARLVDEKGRLITRQELDYQKLRHRSSQTVILGALSRTAAGVPSFPPIRVNNPEMQPVVARLQPSVFPDTPIALSGLNALYLSSERALDLKDVQIKALLAWLQGGGHLIVGVEQVGDVNGTAWLRELVPAQLTGTRQVAHGKVFSQWLQKETSSGTAGALFKAAGTNFVVDPAFESGELQIATGEVRSGRVIAAVDSLPLAIETPMGRGKVTLLTFSPERQPFAAWKNKEWLWTLLAEVPVRFYQTGDFNDWGFSPDSVFGSMIESTQVRKVPLFGLVALLLVYLVIIGPVDQLVLRRMNKQMLTWITFPCYVLMFSALIYFIGFKLRAGESEYTELHLVDIFPNQEKAILRGKTYASIYSPSNARYSMKSEQFMASLRGEYMANWGNGEENSQAQITHVGNRFDAEVSVPVWTSQLYINDWWEPASMPPLQLTVNGPKQFSIVNKLSRPLTNLTLCVDGKIYEVGEVGGSSTKVVDLSQETGTPFRDFARKESSRFLSAAEMRRQTFGSDSTRVRWDLPRAVAAASFITQMNDDGNHRRFLASDDLDLSRFAQEGAVILLAWDAGNTLTKALNRFEAKRGTQNTLLRVVTQRQIQPGNTSN